MKANHNLFFLFLFFHIDVSDTSKILKWKQITTQRAKGYFDTWCFRYFKDTKMKANHNRASLLLIVGVDVSDTSKILKWKQITTSALWRWYSLWCFRYFKDTKMKANHNFMIDGQPEYNDVSDTSKILKWKQITTGKIRWLFKASMFPILQRY